MNPLGASDNLLALARSALLDALIAIGAHRNSVIVVGAQAIYLHTRSAPVAVAEATKDSDLAIDVRTLANDPLIEEAMRGAGFHSDAPSGQPGAWLSPLGIPVDLMVPAALAGKGRRSVSAPPHASRAFRRAVGLEAAVVDNAMMTITAIDSADRRSIEARVAGPAALLVAKLHKLGERHESAPERLVDKDAYDIYRLLRAIPTDVIATALRSLRDDDLAGDVTSSALTYLQELFGRASSQGSFMAGRAEQFIGDPAGVSATCAVLTSDLFAALS